MYPTTNTRNTRRTNFGHLLLAALLFAALYVYVYQFEAVLRFLGTTRSSAEVENLASYRALLFGAIIGGWLSMIIVMVIARRRHPVGSDITPFWVRHNRSQEMGKLIVFPVMSAIICAWGAATIVHYFG